METRDGAEKLRYITGAIGAEFKLEMEGNLSPDCNANNAKPLKNDRTPNYRRVRVNKVNEKQLVTVNERHTIDIHTTQC